MTYSNFWSEKILEFEPLLLTKLQTTNDFWVYDQQTTMTNIRISTALPSMPFITLRINLTEEQSWLFMTI